MVSFVLLRENCVVLKYIYILCYTGSLFYIEQTHPFVEFSHVLVGPAHHELIFSSQVFNELSTDFFFAFFFADRPTLFFDTFATRN